MNPFVNSTGPPPRGQRERNLSLRSRVGLLAALGAGLIVVLVSIAAYVTVRVSLLRQIDDNLLDRAQAAAAGPLGRQQYLAGVPSEAFGAADVRIALVSADGRGVTSRDEDGTALNPPVGQRELNVARGILPTSVRTAMGDDGHTYRVVAVPASQAQGYALVLGQSTDSTDAILRRLGLVLLFVGGAGVGIAAWAGATIARTGLRPVQRLTAAAEHVARTGDLRPVPVQGSDELARLAHAFNSMLSALAAARVRERRLVADAGHELRTPLTSLRTNLDLLAQSEGRPGLSTSDREALLHDVRAQVAELSALVGDLVELAREDPPAAAHTPVDLADILSHAVERVRRRAPGIRFDVDAQPWTVFGDAQ
ncbi:MAG TPA: HAMP domain-containing sensor histidine kinase, partial [Actinopolymorphaceae bacterium]|nr:HAMP domain-containing sensor histidine kinase [Actinopolymorphaceae bacterium]